MLIDADAREQTCPEHQKTGQGEDGDLAARLSRGLGVVMPPAEVDPALGPGPDPSEVAAMAEQQERQDGDREYAHCNVLTIERRWLAEEVRDDEGQTPAQRRQRDVASDDEQNAERHHGDGAGHGVERQHASQAGRDPFASTEPEIDRKRMTQDRRQRHQDRQVWPRGNR